MSDPYEGTEFEGVDFTGGEGFTNIAEYGDWVVLSSGKPASVTRAQPCHSVERGVGYYYDLMFKGGSETMFYHYESEPGVMYVIHGRGEAEPQPVFTVVDQQAVTS